MIMRFQNSCLSMAIAILALEFALGGANAQSPPNTMGNIIGNEGIITQGQQGNNTIIQGPAARHLDDATKEALKTRIPKSRKVSITFQATESDAGPLAKEIYAFFVSEGYSVSRPIGAMMFGVDGAPHGVNVDLNEEHLDGQVEITIGLR